MKKLIKNLSVLFSGLFLVGLVSSCSAPTAVISTWEKENVDEDYDNLVVTALAETETYQEFLVEELVETLDDEAGVSADNGVEAFPFNDIESDAQKEELFENIKTGGVDGVLTVSVIDEQTETRYVPGSVVYDPVTTYDYYGSFWDYYDYWNPRFDEPGYYTTDKVYYLEANLYDADTEELVWSAQSRTYNPVDIEAFANNYSEEIVEELDNKNIIN